MRNSHYLFLFTHSVYVTFFALPRHNIVLSAYLHFRDVAVSDFDVLFHDYLKFSADVRMYADFLPIAALPTEIQSKSASCAQS